MTKLRKTKVIACELCSKLISKPLKPTSKDNLNTVHSFWNYLYHQNVNDDPLSSSNTQENNEHSKIPKLTFSLTFGTPIKPERSKTARIQICCECKAELEKLDKLHKQLESVKNLINCQITKINAIRVDPKTSPINRLTPTGVNFNGCSIGKENISHTLIFLKTICDGIPTHSTKECQTETQSEPLISKGKLQIGEEFVSVVKAVPDLIENYGENKLPEKDPLETLLESKFKQGKYTKRLEVLMWKGPKKVYCRQCKKNILGWYWERHEKLHKGERQFKCDLCPEKFIWKCNLYRHQRMHQKQLSKSKNITTENTDEQVHLVEKTETNDLDISLTNQGTDEIENALDIEVGKEFVSIIKMEPDLVEEADLQVPLKDPLEIPDAPVKPVGKESKRVPCKLCKKTVIRRNWETHQKWHVGENQFKCELCDERFTHINSLPRHMRWHQKEIWIHACDKCGKKFLHNYKRKSHQTNCQGTAK